MNKPARLTLGLLLALAFGLANAASDEEKLKELERAMSAPTEAAKPKMRTRAIVFDNQPQGAAQAAPEAAPPAPAAPRDCATVSPDARAVAVDFAIQFNVGSATISPVSEKTLNDISKILSMSPDRCVIVEGHTDSSGNFDKNMALSRDRAYSVVNYISTRNGVDRKRLIPIGKGSTDTLPNLDPRDSKNRRVVFKVVSG